MDRYTPRSRFYDQARYLGRALGMNYVYGAVLKWAPCIGYGNAVLSRWPFVNKRSHLLPGSGERRGLLEVEIRDGSKSLILFCTHLGLSRKDRVKQVNAVLDLLTLYRGRPLILVGDINAERNSSEYSLIKGILQDATEVSGCFYTYPSQSPSFQPDFIFTSCHWQIVSSYPVISAASDHLAVVSEISL